MKQSCRMQQSAWLVAMGIPDDQPHLIATGHSEALHQFDGSLGGPGELKTYVLEPARGIDTIVSTTIDERAANKYTIDKYGAVEVDFDTFEALAFDDLKYLQVEPPIQPYLFSGCVLMRLP